MPGSSRQRCLYRVAALDLQLVVCRHQYRRPAARLMPYIGGFPVYVQKCNEVMSSGFAGFVLDGGHRTNTEPQVRFTERWRVPLDVEVISPAQVAARRVPMV